MTSKLGEVTDQVTPGSVKEALLQQKGSAIMTKGAKRPPTVELDAKGRVKKNAPEPEEKSEVKQPAPRPDPPIPFAEAETLTPSTKKVSFVSTAVGTMSFKAHSLLESVQHLVVNEGVTQQELLIMVFDPNEPHWVPAPQSMVAITCEDQSWPKARYTGFCLPMADSDLQQLVFFLE